MTLSQFEERSTEEFHATPGSPGSSRSLRADREESNPSRIRRPSPSRTGGILVNGSEGQIGSELVPRLRRHHEDPARVVGLDIQIPQSQNGRRGTHVKGDVRDRDRLEEVILRNGIKVIYHLASLLSAEGEQRPNRAWDVNMGGLRNVLDLAREHNLKVFWPSSIAVFGPSTPKTDTPQNTVLDPTTMYGVTKRSGELLCRYYHRRYEVDVRSVRYPGLLSYKTIPEGGTTDYAVYMHEEAAKGKDYSCFLKPDTSLPMMYMPDAIRATLLLMDADGADLSVRDGYNIAALSFTPRDLARVIRGRIPGFTCTYDPDERQEITDSWPNSINDETAREDWGWTPEYDLNDMSEDMLAGLRTKELI